MNTAAVLTELAVGEALVSFLDEKGQPRVVERAFILPPHRQIGSIKPEQRRQLIESSVVFGAYEKFADRESTCERLKGSVVQAPSAPGQESSDGGFFGKLFGGGDSPAQMMTGRPCGRVPDTLAQTMAKSAV